MCGGGGDPTFSKEGGGSNANFKETHIICDFPGGGVRTSYPPLDPHHDDDDDDDDDDVDDDDDDETFSI